MVVVETALFVAGLGAGLAGGYTIATRRDGPSDGQAGDSNTDSALGEGHEDTRYQTVADNFPKGSVALFDDDLQYTLATGGVFEYIDFGPEDFEGHAIADIFVGEFVDDHLHKYSAVFEGEESTFEMRHGDRFYRKHLVPVTDDDGTVVAGVEMTRDITELREREDALEASEQRYRALAENFPRGSIALLDENREFTLVTGQVFEYVDSNPEDFEGNRLDDLFLPGFVERHGPKYDAVFEGGEATFEMRHGDRFYRKYLVPVTDETGAVGRCLEMTVDITALREREEELQRQNDRLEEFASIVSHDLRNPLNVALGRVELIEGAENDEHVRSIRKSLDRMTALIDDMLTLARQGRTVEDPERIALGTTATDAWEHVESEHATLVTDLDEAVTGDPGRVMQLFENLFRNAVEHGSTSNRTQSDDAVEHGSTSPDSQARQDSVEHGRTDVTVTVGPTPDGFYVADDGPGIPESDREAVFEHGHTTNEDGTGFGLAIVENVASAHGWSVSVTDSESGGARFEFDTSGASASGAAAVELAAED
jgi:signal transduction histidine kinase